MKSPLTAAALMSRFYRKLLEEKKRPAAALREMQLAMLGHEGEPRWRAPFYWAAFTLQGEWR